MPANGQDSKAPPVTVTLMLIRSGGRPDGDTKTVRLYFLMAESLAK